MTHVLCQFEFSLGLQPRSSDQCSSSASVINEIPSNLPVTWTRYASALVSPLNSIDTTSVSTMAAPIANDRRQLPHGAIDATYRRTLRRTHPRAKASQVAIQSRQSA